MATVGRQSGEIRESVREAAGGEELIEVEKGVRVRKTGGVEFAPTLSLTQIEERRQEISVHIEHQKLVIHRAKEEALNAGRQASDQATLAREAAEFKVFNRKRQLEAADEARILMIEVTALVQKEQDLEKMRAEAHHAAVQKEKERVNAKTAEIIAREEAIEAEKREQYHSELVRKCQANTLRYKLEEQQAALKLESLQFNLQHGELGALPTAGKAKIIVEVEPRELPEARQFDMAPLEASFASAELNEEIPASRTETRTVEEILSYEKTSSSSYTSQSGLLKAEESNFPSRSFEVYESSAPTDIKMLPELKSSAPSSAVVLGEAPGSQPTPPSAEQYSQQYGSSTAFQQSQAAPQQATTAASSQPNVPQQAAPQQVGSQQSSAEEPTDQNKKKQKSSGFFKKFRAGKTGHEQH